MLKEEYGIKSINASTTGNSVVLSGQGTGTSIKVWGLYFHALTATANQVVAMNDNTTSNGFYFSQNLAAKADTINLAFTKPWMLGTNGAANINLATAGAVAVTMLYDVEQR